MFARPRALRQERIDLGPLLRETASLIERDPTMLNLEIRVSGGCEIVGDREMLQIVFQNILMNGAQAMGGQGQIEVAIAGAGGRCRIAVVDRGPGMPEETRAKAFDAFFTTKHRGTGLGLTLANASSRGARRR